MAKVAVIGGGALGGAVLRGLQGSDHQLFVVEPDASKVFQGATRVETAPACDLAIIAVKPALVASVLPSLQKAQVVVSLAAGVSAAELRAGLGQEPRLYRGMLSTAAAQRMTTTTLCPETAEAPPAWLEGVFETLGDVLWSEEKLLDAIMTLSASAPAFFLAAAEGLADGGVRLGLGRALAEQLALGALRSAFSVGSAETMTPAKYKITSPGGVTIEGLAVLERMATKAAFSDAAVACVAKVRSMK